ncbi:hypothetical protein ACOMHN_040911 [Nucella lapillus]
MANSQPQNCPSLKEKADQNQLKLSSEATTNGTDINVTCVDKEIPLVGESQLTCTSGNWSSALPTCSAEVKLSEREIIIIAASCSVIFVILVVLIVVVVCYYRTKARSRQQSSDRLAATLERLKLRYFVVCIFSSDRLAATLERLSIRDPLDELVRRESGRSFYGNPAFTSSSYEDNDTDKSNNRVSALNASRLEVPVTGAAPGRDGVQLSRQALSTWHYPATNRVSKSVKLYKIWDHTRTRRQFVFAENLDELIIKGGEKLNLSGPIRVVLEEDGTEIDNDAVLRACAGMVFLLLEQNQVWGKPEVLLSVHEYSNNLNHYRYDIDEKL